jgi:3-oxoadipate enol-lactonase
MELSGLRGEMMDQTRETQFADVNGTRLAYRIIGSGEPLVLIHGYSLDTRMWDSQINAFAEKYQVIAYDVRGFGKSAPVGDESYSSVDDLKALLDHLGIGSAHLIGLSMGGGIASAFAAVHPRMVRSLILVDAIVWGFQGSAEWEESLRVVRRAAQEGGVAGAKAAWLAHALFAPAREKPRVKRQLETMVADFSGWHWLHRDRERGLEPPTIQRLGEIMAPTLVLVGDRDLPDFIATAECYVQGLPLATRVVLPDVGHMANMEDPALFNAIVLAFLRKV